MNLGDAVRSHVNAAGDGGNDRRALPYKCFQDICPRCHHRALEILLKRLSIPWVTPATNDRLLRNHRGCNTTPPITFEFKVCTATIAKTSACESYYQAGCSTSSSAAAEIAVDPCASTTPYELSSEIVHVQSSSWSSCWTSPRTWRNQYRRQVA